MTTSQETNWLQMAREAFNGSTTYFDSSIRPTIEANMRQFQGVHPSGSKYHADSYKSRSRLFRPKTRTTIRKNEAVAAEAFFSTDDVVSIKAENETDDFQRASAEVMRELLQYRLKKTIPWFITCIGAYQEAQAVGVVASYQYWKYDEKKKVDKPCVELIPVENLRIDAASDWSDPINTSPYLIHLIPMYVKDVKAKMVKIDGKTGQPKWKTVSDSQILASMHAYSDTTRQTRERGRTDSKEQQTAVRDFAVVWVHKNIVEVDGQDYIYFTLGTEVLLTDPKPLNESYFHGRRPYVMGFSILETHKIYPGGVSEITKDIQAEINELANQRIDNVKFVLNKRYFVKRNRQVDLRSVTRNIPGSVTMVTDHDDVKVQDTTDVTASSYQEQDRLNLDFDDVSGSFSGASVQSNRKLNETVGGMEILSTGSNQVSGYQLRTFVETWVEPVLRQLVLLEQHYETDQVLLALAGNNAKLFQKFKIDKVTDELLEQELTLNVNVGIGATNPHDQVRNFLSGIKALREVLDGGLLEKYGLKVDEVIKEIFGKLGYKDGGRFFDMENEDPQVTALKATISEMQQALTAKVNPELVAKQIEKIDAEVAKIIAQSKDVQAAAIKKGVETAFAAMQAGEVIAAVPAVAPIADEVMKSAGYRSPTGGQDPNFPQPAAAAPGLTANPIKDPRTGIEFTPGAAGDTTPMTPANPETAVEGVTQGIETKEADSV